MFIVERQRDFKRKEVGVTPKQWLKKEQVPQSYRMHLQNLLFHHWRNSKRQPVKNAPRFSSLNWTVSISPCNVVFWKKHHSWCSSVSEVSGVQTHNKDKVCKHSMIELWTHYLYQRMEDPNLNDQEAVVPYQKWGDIC